MQLTPSLFLKARPLAEVAAVGALVSVGILMTVDATVPSLTAGTLAYSASTTFRIAPALASVVVLALTASRLDAWESLAARRLYWRRLVLGVGVMALAVVLLLPAALTTTTPQPVLVVVQGVLACSGLGMLVSRLLPYPGQASVAFFYGLVSLNAAWAAHGPVAAVLAIGVPPSPAGLAVAGLVAAVGVGVQAMRSSRLLE